MFIIKWPQFNLGCALYHLHILFSSLVSQPCFEMSVLLGMSSKSACKCKWRLQVDAVVGRGKPFKKGCVSGRGSGGVDINISECRSKVKRKPKRPFVTGPKRLPCT